MKITYAHTTLATRFTSPATTPLRQATALPAPKTNFWKVNQSLEMTSKNLETQDRMGNFEIQRLMSAFNQAETLASNVQKKADDTVSGQSQKIG
jgi:hypothetical protein